VQDARCPYWTFGAPPLSDSALRQTRYTTALALLASLRAISVVRYQGELGPNIVNIVLAMTVFVGQHEGRPFTAHKLSQYLRMPRPTVTRKLERMVSDGVLERQGTYYTVRDEYLDRGEALGMMRELAQIIYSACRFLPNLDNLELDIQKKSH
jgi:DNA-binding MarR family transcriptional regulator